MSMIQTTDGRPVHSLTPEFITLYAPDGTPHKCAPVDAREILAANAGYTEQPPVMAVESAPDEQQPEQQPIASYAPIEDAQTAAQETGEEVLGAAFQTINKKRSSRSSK